MRADMGLTTIVSTAVRSVWWIKCLALAGVVCSLSCMPASWWNNTASLGGDVPLTDSSPEGRSDIQVSFINNTPYRAIFTFGSYDPLSYDPVDFEGPNGPNFVMEFDQFGVASDASTRLEGNTSSDIFTFTCGRAISVGGKELVQRLIEQEMIEVAEGEETVDQFGISFSDKPLDDAEADEPTAGRDAGLVTLQGVEFQCESLLVYTFELDENEADGIRIDLKVVLP